MNENIGKFVDEVRLSISGGTFVKVSLGNYKGLEEHLQKISARLVQVRKAQKLSFTKRYKTRDVVENLSIDEGVAHLASLISTHFFSAHLATTDADLQLDISKKGKTRLLRRAAERERPGTEHNRGKTELVDRRSRYLHLLGITTADGNVKDKQQFKWRQMNKFVETAWAMIGSSELRDRNELSIVDMGSGKGYLTFALYDHLVNEQNKKVDLTGIEARAELVDLCNSVAHECGFDALSFRRGSVAETRLENVDMLIALHACDTATDDALYKGLSAGAEVILTAPCCHKEIRPQIVPPEHLQPLFSHGSLAERMAETITDALRAQILKENGYDARVFEFIAPEDTPKNNMIAAVKTKRNTTSVESAKEMMRHFGIIQQRLADLVATGG